ncbi:MAG: Beta-lactamase domain protein [Candidatus Yanofskybacteria bacterium GW2011_GWC2_37_9]|uniref:Beta-lactamase domain protein n=1 Tax=Candidatus Yanofskybacteria bacterium GW2011_GWC2_37_9 TaxID=1619028 RepID=A0A0G0KEF0_9BACT|nr:MAG: Beta-lactamase domain protein [Candidatus Yanofskybacteria bacterium GW2011_GWC2_37_9]
MIQSGRKYGLFVFTFLLLLATIFLFYQDFKNSYRGLIFVMLDVDQGDSLFIESPTGTQILIDAGPPRKILSQLSRVMSPFDRTIDGIIITNPDQDHIGGFADVLKNYKVDMVFESGTLNDSKTFQNLKTEIKNKNIPDILAKKGMRLNIGGGAVIDVLFPDRDVFDWSPNDGSIVAKLTYGNTSVMLTGDATTETEKIILAGNSKDILSSTFLKVGHHGSRTSTGVSFVQAVAPTYALISDGKNNNYGHPHQDTLDTLASFGAKIFRTDLMGAIIMKSDGKKEVFSFYK